MLPTNYRVAAFPSVLTHGRLLYVQDRRQEKSSKNPFFFKKICFSLISSVLVGMQDAKDILDLSSNGDLCRTDSFTIRTIRGKKYGKKMHHTPQIKQRTQRVGHEESKNQTGTRVY